MSSLYNISKELDDIFFELEENGGEITPELEERLQLTEDNFHSKISSYVDYIKHLESELDLCKCESNRIRDYKKHKENDINKMKSCLIDAIISFGECNSKGVRYIDYGLGKISIRRSTKCEVDDRKVAIIFDLFYRYVKNLIAINQYFGTIDKDEVINYINDCVKDLDIEDKFIVDEEDLKYITVKLEANISLHELTKESSYGFIKYIDEAKFDIITPSTADKSEIKSYLQETSNNLCFAENVENKSLTIK